MRCRFYELSVKENLLVIAKTIGITAMIMLLFYRSFWAIVLSPLVWIFEIKESKNKVAEEKERALKTQFLHGIGVLNSSLQAGLSMENAWKEVERESKLLYGIQSRFYIEIKEMNHKVAHNAPIEKLFLEVAYKLQLEDIIQFAELLEYGKRSGSNWKKIIDVTVNQMTERQEAKEEIEVMVAEKRMEQKVMNIMPIGLLVFLQLSAWDYMDVLYHNLFGVISMTIFLAGYAGAIVLSKKIVKVKL